MRHRAFWCAALVLAAAIAAHVDAAISDQRMWTWGSNANGECGQGELATAPLSPTMLTPDLTGVKDFAAGETHALAVTDTAVYAWGQGSGRRLCQGAQTLNQVAPQEVTPLSSTPVAAAAGGTPAEGFSVIATTFDVYVCGSNSNTAGNAPWLASAETTLGGDDIGTPTALVPALALTAVSAGRSHVLGLRSDGTVVSWGLNTDGQLGRTGSLQTPTAIPGLGTVKAISAGARHSLAVLDNGEVWAWGDNANGQAGLGGLASSSTPVQVTGVAGAVDVSAGDDHSLIVTSDGSVYAMGRNANFRTGLGTSAGTQTTPKKLSLPSDMNGASMVSAGGAWSMIADSNGLIYSFGLNDEGQADPEGTAADVASPSRVPGVSFRAHTNGFSKTAGGKFAGAVMAKCPCVHGECDGDVCKCPFLISGEFCSEQIAWLQLLQTIGVFAAIVIGAIGVALVGAFILFVGIARIAVPKKRQSEYHEVLFTDDKALGVGSSVLAATAGVAAASDSAGGTGGAKKSAGRKKKPVRRASGAQGAAAAAAGGDDGDDGGEPDVEAGEPTPPPVKEPEEGHTLYDWFEGLIVAQPSLAIVMFAVDVQFNYDLFARNLIYIFESNNKTMALVKLMLNRDFRRAADATALLKPASPTSKVLQQYSRIMGIGYARRVVGFVVEEVKHGRLTAPGQNAKSITTAATSLLRTLGDTIDDMPVQVRQICNHILKTAEAGKLSGMRIKLVGMYLFSRFLCNAISHPEEYGLADEPWDKDKAAAVKVLNRCLAAAFSGQRFSAKDKGADDLNAWAESSKETIQSFLQLASSLPGMGGGGRSSIRSSIAALSARGFIQPPAVEIPFPQLVNALEQTYLHLFRNRLEINGMISDPSKFDTPKNLQMQLNTVINKIGRPEGMSTMSSASRF